MDNIVFKVIVLGHQGVGKTAMLTKYIKGEFVENYNVTVGVEFQSKTVRIDEEATVKMQIWDTAGQEAFRAIMRSFYKGICGIFLIFCIDDEESFNKLDEWVKEAHQNAHQQAVFFLVGTKSDLEEHRKVTAEMAREYVSKIGAIFYVETSAKNNYNVELLFEKAAKVMYKKFSSNGAYRGLVMPMMSSMVERTPSFRLQDNMPEKKKGCC